MSTPEATLVLVLRLRAAATRAAKARGLLAVADALRDNEIRAAAASMTHRRIAAVVGLSPQRVDQIVANGPKEPHQ